MMNNEVAGSHATACRPVQGVRQVGAVLFLGWVLHATPGLAAEPPLAGDRIATQDGDLTIHPVNHATLVLHWKGLAIYVDPVGGANRFAALPRAGLILITDIHGDHLDLPTLDQEARG